MAEITIKYNVNGNNRDDNYPGKSYQLTALNQNQPEVQEEKLLENNRYLTVVVSNINSNSQYCTFGYNGVKLHVDALVKLNTNEEDTLIGDFNAEWGKLYPTNSSTNIRIKEVIYVHCRLYYTGTQKEVTFNSNGGTLIGSNKITVQNYSTYSGVPTATKNNFSFANWYITPQKGNYGPVTNGDFIALASNIILYANWNSTITYKRGYGDPEEVIQTQVITDYGSISIINLDKTYRLGYTLTSWNTQLNGGGTSYNPGETYYGKDGNIILYAQWKEQELPSKTFNIQYAPQNVNMTKTPGIDEVELNFSRHEPYGTNGYFNCLRVNYNYIDDQTSEKKQKTADIEENFYNENKSMTLQLVGDTELKQLKYGERTLFEIDTSGQYAEPTILFVYGCKLNNQFISNSTGMLYKDDSYTFENTKPYITNETKFLFPFVNNDVTFLQQNSTNVCIYVKVKKRQETYSDDVDIYVNSIKYNTITSSD